MNAGKKFLTCVSVRYNIFVSGLATGRNTRGICGGEFSGLPGRVTPPPAIPGSKRHRRKA
mgnify:CR=1 FL=1